MTLELAGSQWSYCCASAKERKRDTETQKREGERERGIKRERGEEREGQSGSRPLKVQSAVFQKWALDRVLTVLERSRSMGSKNQWTTKHINRSFLGLPPDFLFQILLWRVFPRRSQEKGSWSKKHINKCLTPAQSRGTPTKMFMFSGFPLPKSRGAQPPGQHARWECAHIRLTIPNSEGASTRLWCISPLFAFDAWVDIFLHRHGSRNGTFSKRLSLSTPKSSFEVCFPPPEIWYEEPPI